MITPRRTRLVRVRDLHDFRLAIERLCGAAPAATAGTAAVIVPTRDAGEQLAAALARGVDLPHILTRDQWYDLMHARLADAPRRLTAFERDGIMQAAALQSARAVQRLSFRLRPGLIAEMLRFYDQLKRQAQPVARFEELIVEALGGGEAEGDRGAERLLVQTRFLSAAFSDYERRAAATGACDEHGLRARLLADPLTTPLRRLVVSVGDWIADPGGLFAVDFDLLSRVSGLAEIDVVGTEAVFASGFHERLHGWLPGIEEVDGAEIVGVAPPSRPMLLTPPDSDRLWFTLRDREEELTAIAGRVAADSCDRVAVVFKRPLPYLYAAPETLGAAGIPYRSPASLPLAGEPRAAAIDLVLDLVETGFARAPLIELLRSPHFRLGVEGVPRASIAALDRRLSMQRYLGDLAKLEALAGDWSDALSRPALDAGLAVGRALAPLLDEAPASLQIRRLIEWLTANGQGCEADDPLADRERRAAAAIERILDALAAAHEAHHDPPWTIEQLAPAVRRWIEEETFQTAAGERGVHLIDDQAARYGDFEELTCVGLIEQEWPERPRRNIFYPPGLLRALGWPSEKDRRAADDARFLDLLASASARVAVSTVTLDDEALVMRSSQLDEIPRARLSSAPLAAATGRRPLHDDLLAGDSPDVDAFDAGTREWLAARLNRSADAPELHGQTGPLPARTWSVSALEIYLKCPFKFFAQHVLKLEEEPEDEQAMDPRRQGQLVHEVFEAFFRAWQRAGSGAITPANIDQARAMFVEVVDRQLARVPGAEAALERTRLLGSPAAAGLGEAVLRMEAERTVPVVERLLEHKLDGEVEIMTRSGQRRIAIRGKADRIDLLADGTFRLVDYKLGWPPQRSRALQLPIYSLSAEQRLDGIRGRSWQLSEAVYLAFKGPKRVVPLYTTPAERDKVMADAQDRLAAAVDAIARGEFPPTPDDVYWCETCSYAAVCRKDYVGEV